MATVTATKQRESVRTKKTPVPKLPSYWDTESITIVARLLDNFLESDGITQNDLAVKIGLSSTTLTNFRRNSSGPFSRPDLNTLVRIAPYLINPDTKRPFSGSEIVAFCSGAQKAKNLLEYAKATQTRQGQSLEALASACEVSLSRLIEVLENPESLSGPDRLMWLVVLGGKLGNVPRLAKFMGVTPSVCAG